MSVTKIRRFICPLVYFAADLSESLLKKASEKRSNSESDTNIDHDDCDAVLMLQLNRLKEAKYALLRQYVFNRIE